LLQLPTPQDLMVYLITERAEEAVMSAVAARFRLFSLVNAFLLLLILMTWPSEGIQTSAMAQSSRYPPETVLKALREPKDNCSPIELTYPEVEELGKPLSDPTSTIEELKKTKFCMNCSLEGAILTGVLLDGAVLDESVLSGASLGGIHLKGALATGTKFIGARLQDADLREARLDRACFLNADLRGTDFKDAQLTGAILDNAIFEPKSLPDLQAMNGVHGLRSLTWDTKGPGALFALRKAFKEAGMYDHEREVTYAIKRGERPRSNTLISVIELLFVELPSEWGTAPLRPLWIMLGLVLPFTALYAISIPNSRSQGALWLVWSKDRVKAGDGANKSGRLNSNNCSVLFSSLHFSIISAFSVGLKDLDVGSWIARLFPWEYTIRGTGWVRSVSGLQSMISVYLLGLWFVTFFGHPFE